MGEARLFNHIVLAADPNLGGALAQLLLPFVLIVLIFYFLVTRPQQQQRRKMQELLASLKTGDRVITTGGIFGTIVGFGEGVVQLQVANQVRIEVSRSAITGLASSESAAKGEKGAGRSESGRRDVAAKGKKP